MCPCNRSTICNRILPPGRQPNILAYAIESSPQDLCRYIEGKYSCTTNSCFDYYGYPKLNWPDSFDVCTAMAPNGMVGRLAHIQSYEVFDITKRYQGWVGAKSLVPGSTGKRSSVLYPSSSVFRCHSCKELTDLKLGRYDN